MIFQSSYEDHIIWGRSGGEFILKTQGKRDNKSTRYSRLGLLGIILTAVLLLVNINLKSNELREKLDNCSRQIKSFEEHIAEEEQRTIEINNLRDYMKTDAYAEEAARTRLGLVKENEFVFQEESAMQ